MRIDTLSNHAADQARMAAAGREAAYHQALQRWQGSVDNRAGLIADARDAIRTAWRQRQWIDLAKGMRRWLAAHMIATPPMPQLAPPSEQESRWASGEEGERRVLDTVATVLGDDWLALKGYLNRGGETDLLLIGPTCVAAVEIKYINGTVHCNGNDWSRDKSDRYGNVVERGVPIRDRQGRAPNEQVNASAKALEEFLARRGHRVQVRRAVVLAHDASRLGSVREPGVDFIGPIASPEFSTRFTRFLITASEATPLNASALEALVRRDHAFHAERRQGGPRNGSRTPPTPAPPPSTPERTARLSVQPPAPLLPPLELAPPTADIFKPLPELQLRQVQDLLAQARALHASQGRDLELRRRVRQAVVGHLKNGAKWTVLSMVQGQAGEADATLRPLLVECREVLELEARTLRAITVPMAVRWQLLPEDAHGATAQLELHQVVHSWLGGAGAFIAARLGVKAVKFSSRLYPASSLRQGDERDFWAAMQRIEAGEEPDATVLKTVGVKPMPEPDWFMVFLLGVITTEPDDDLDIEDEAIQRELAGQMHQFESTFGIATKLIAKKPQQADARAEGVWSLERGLVHGLTLRRRHLLERALLRAGAGIEPLRCWYTGGRVTEPIDLLVTCGRHRSRQSFPSLGVPDELGSFRVTLDEALAARLPPGHTAEVNCLDRVDFLRQARTLGLTWVGEEPRRGGDA